MNNIEQYQVPCGREDCHVLSNCSVKRCRDGALPICWPLHFMHHPYLVCIHTFWHTIPTPFYIFLFSCYIFLKISRSRSVCVDAVPAAAAVTLRTYATHSSSGNSLQSANIVRSNTAVECGCRVCATSLSPYRTLTTSIHQHQTSLHF